MRKKVPQIGILLAITLNLPLLASRARLPEAEDVYPDIPKWRNSRILHIGDSHVSRGLTAKLAKFLRRAGAAYQPEGWIGSRSKSWIKSGKARKLIESYRPNVVIVTLGTNEMTNRKPTRHRSWIRALVDRIGPRTCYWVGPPPLLDDRHGYYDFIKDQVAPCRYFDSRILEVRRKPHGVFHLSRNEGENWAGLIWKWMNGN